MSSAETSCELTITSAQHGQRLDAVLSRYSGLSRSRIRQMLEQGLLQGPVQKPSARVKSGETYRWTLPENRPLDLVAEDIALDILYEDEYLIIINKPAGMVVHPSHGHDQGTLVHALLHHCPDLPGINGVERPGIVHRLDKDTSGSIVVAKTETAHQRLTAMFAAHDLQRQYLAWCRGTPGWHHKTIDLPIARHPAHRQKMAVVKPGRHAVTDAEVEACYGPFCRLRLTLHTGRTHQIRVHLSHIGLPLLGDPVYARRFNPGKEIPTPVREALGELKRQALHAEVLAFQHPISGQEIAVTAPLPDDLQYLSAALTHAYP